MALAFLKKKQRKNTKHCFRCEKKQCVEIFRHTTEKKLINNERHYFKC